MQWYMPPDGRGGGYGAAPTPYQPTRPSPTPYQQFTPTDAEWWKRMVPTGGYTGHDPVSGRMWGLPGAPMLSQDMIGQAPPNAGPQAGGLPPGLPPPDMREQTQPSKPWGSPGAFPTQIGGAPTGAMPPGYPPPMTGGPTGGMTGGLSGGLMGGFGRIGSGSGYAAPKVRR